MPRKRFKTAADLPTYRRPSLPSMATEDELEGFLEGLTLRRIVDKYGVDGHLILGIIAEQARRELIERRNRETLDAMKMKLRPLASATTASPAPLQTSDARRGGRQYRRHREETVDFAIRQQARVRQLETGLIVILESEPDSWHRRELVEIVDAVKAGMTVAQITQALGVSPSKVERCLAELRQASGSGQIDGRGTDAPTHIEGQFIQGCPRQSGSGQPATEILGSIATP